MRVVYLPAVFPRAVREQAGVFQIAALLQERKAEGASVQARSRPGSVAGSAVAPPPLELRVKSGGGHVLINPPPAIATV